MALIGFSTALTERDTARPSAARPWTESIKSAKVLAGKRICIVLRSLSGRHGGNLSTAILIERLRDAGALVQVVSVAKRLPSAGPRGRTDFVAGKGGWLGRTSRLAIEIMRHDIVLVVGEKPRVIFLMAQMFRSLVFVRFDTILTCPSNSRYLPRSETICDKRPGPLCLKVHRREGCLSGMSEVKRLGRIGLRMADMMLIQLFRHFATNSRACADRYQRTAQVFYPPCPTPQQIRFERPSADVAFVARLDGTKGVLDAIAVFAKATQAGHLHILGDGPERGAAERTVREAGLALRVTFHGWVDKAKRENIWGRCGVTLMCSKWDEAFGRVGPESYALGIPVVAYDVGGVREWCRPPAGTFVPCGDRAGAAAAIDDLLSNHAVWAEASRAAIGLASEFCEDRYGEEWISYLTRIDSHRKRTGCRRFSSPLI